VLVVQHAQQFGLVIRHGTPPLETTSEHTFWFNRDGS
jgi:hypothetical protein